MGTAFTKLYAQAFAQAAQKDVNSAAFTIARIAVGAQIRTKFVKFKIIQLADGGPVLNSVGTFVILNIVEAGCMLKMDSCQL